LYRVIIGQFRARNDRSQPSGQAAHVGRGNRFGPSPSTHVRRSSSALLPIVKQLVKRSDALAG
jgi:hypothetical protein